MPFCGPTSFASGFFALFGGLGAHKSTHVVSAQPEPGLGCSKAGSLGSGVAQPPAAGENSSPRAGGLLSLRPSPALTLMRGRFTFHIHFLRSILFVSTKNYGEIEG